MPGHCLKYRYFTKHKVVEHRYFTKHKVVEHRYFTKHLDQKG